MNQTSYTSNNNHAEQKKNTQFPPFYAPSMIMAQSQTIYMPNPYAVNGVSND
jgi:hypothetical protein